MAQEKKTYSTQTIVDFVKTLEKSNLIVKGTHKNDKVVATIKQCCELTPTELEQYKDNAKVCFFNTEFSDWIETYNP